MEALKVRVGFKDAVVLGLGIVVASVVVKLVVAGVSLAVLAIVGLFI